MDPSVQIDWLSNQSHLYLNPKLPEKDLQILSELSQKFAKPGTIWIASSGSTKAPDESLKLIALSKKAFLSSGEAVNQHLQVNSKDVWLLNLPTFHVGGLSFLARAFLGKNQVVQQLKWDPVEFSNFISKNFVTLTSLVPTQVFDLVSHALKAPPSLRAVVVGGGKLDEKIYSQAIDLGWPLLPSFGMTELCSQIATAELGSWKTKNPRLKILSHVECKTNEESLLFVRGKSLMNGYAQEKKGVLQWEEPFLDGWYLSQDQVELQDGYLIPKGRSHSFLKILGEGVQLEFVQSSFDQLLRSKHPQLISMTQIKAFQEDRAGARLVLEVLQTISDQDILDLQSIVTEFNQKISPPERLSEISKVSHISWKR